LATSRFDDRGVRIIEGERMQKIWIVVLCLGTTMAVAACGKDKNKEGGGSEAKGAEGAGEGAAADDGPSLDCSAFATKMTECIDPFAEAYSKTEFGSKAGKNLDGTVDHEAAAKRFKMLWDLQGEKLCSGGGDGVMDAPYVERDPRWRKRFAGCDNSAACDAWVPCMSSALGDLLPAN